MADVIDVVNGNSNYTNNFTESSNIAASNMDYTVNGTTFSFESAWMIAVNGGFLMITDADANGSFNISIVDNGADRDEFTFTLANGGASGLNAGDLVITGFVEMNAAGELSYQLNFTNNSGADLDLDFFQYWDNDIINAGGNDADLIAANVINQSNPNAAEVFNLIATDVNDAPLDFAQTEATQFAQTRNELDTELAADTAPVLDGGAFPVTNIDVTFAMSNVTGTIANGDTFTMNFNVRVEEDNAETVLISTKNNANVGGTNVRNGDIAVFEEGDAANTIQLQNLENEIFKGKGSNIDALHSLGNDQFLISTTVNTKIILGGVGIKVKDGDIIQLDFTNQTAVVLVAEDDVFDKGSNIDALSIDGNGNFLISTKGDGKIGDLKFKNGDIVSFNQADPQGTIVVVANENDIFRKNENIDALHFVDDNTFLISTSAKKRASQAEINGILFDADDIVQLDPQAVVALLRIEGAEIFNRQDDIDAFSVFVENNFGFRAEVSDASVVLTWNHPAKAVAFNVWRRDQNSKNYEKINDFQRISIPKIGEQTYRDTQIDPQKSYSYKVELIYDNKSKEFTRPLFVKSKNN